MSNRRFLLVAAAVGVLLAPQAVVAAQGGGQGKPGPADTLDLAVSLSDSPDPVMIGSEFSYDAVVANVGTVTAADVHLRVSVRHGFPHGTAVYSSVTSSRGSCSMESYGSGEDIPLGAVSDLWLVMSERVSVPVCAVGSLAPGEQATMRVVVRPTWIARENTYGLSPLDAYASHSLQYRDNNRANDWDYEDTTVTVGNELADCVLDRHIRQLCIA